MTFSRRSKQYFLIGGGDGRSVTWYARETGRVGVEQDDGSIYWFGGGGGLVEVQEPTEFNDEMWRLIEGVVTEQLAKPNDRPVKHLKLLQGGRSGS